MTKATEQRSGGLFGAEKAKKLCRLSAVHPAKQPDLSRNACGYRISLHQPAANPVNPLPRHQPRDARIIGRAAYSAAK